MRFRVALCGLSANDRHLVEVVLTRAPIRRYRFAVLPPEVLERVHIAIVDADNPEAEVQYREVRARNASVIAVDLSDGGFRGRTRYRLARPTLLSRVLGLLDEVVEGELDGRSMESTRTPIVAPDPGTNPGAG